ncbi:hypothetical protein RD110_11025 [Rhodoferax koreense]|uniref:Uncharacterized protein n=1 Tax=Rhodoferax koreensis TaxID=1842727 RepID=A0A1P8JV65_9BURK|nr:hypothetical protein [Rhodoferax koreense]APW37659.1 hypothetical protein RD110_11025 [Rhodoferax koreense]
MPDAIIGQVAGAAVGGLLGGGDSGGGAGTTTATKEPWAEAAPWIKSNLATGQALQSQYAANPFNQQQLAALGNMGNQTSYMNTLIPDLLGQISGQQTGFNRDNPSARPASYNFGTTGNQSGNSGLLAMLAQRQQTAPMTTTAGLGYAIPQATMAMEQPVKAPATGPQYQVTDPFAAFNSDGGR